MSAGLLDPRVPNAVGRDSRAIAQGAARWLHLAATPTCALMAVMTWVQDPGAPDVLCAMTGTLPFNGMTLMYLLMSLFHATPWLKLASVGLAHETTR